MKIYFDEVFNCKKTTTFNIYEGLDQKSLDVSRWKDIIEQRIKRNKSNNKHSYPDSKILEDESDEHYLNTCANEFKLDMLIRKFEASKETGTNSFTRKVVYDLHRDCSNNNTSLLFDSHFECGNLNTVIQINELEYDLILSPDIGSFKGLQWFYFQITNIRSGLRYTFNIVNFLKVNSQYNYGMQPLLFSVTDYMLNGAGWQRVGENIAYFGNNYTNNNGSRQYRTLSFSISFKYTNDCVYFAYHYPYTYTRLMTILYPIYANNSNNIYTRVDKLCETVNHNEVPLLTITAAFNKSEPQRIPINERPIIFITARVHPGETNSSWIAEGMIKFLLNETNEEASRIRECFIFKIIPMLNIEGVIYGNTRSGTSGNDLNRCWANPQQNSCSEIYYTKKLIEFVRKATKQEITACIDIHGHSRKKYFFFYGCNPKMSWKQEDWKQNDCLEALKVLPRLTSTLNPHIRLNFCRYRVENSRESTARVVMWREFGIQNSYTLECSYCSGDNEKTINTKILTDIGANVIAALGMMHDHSL